MSDARTLSDRLLRLPEVSKMAGVSETSLYRMVKEKRFPSPLRLGPIVRWRESEILAWMDALPRHDPDLPAALQGARLPPRQAPS